MSTTTMVVCSRCTIRFSSSEHLFHVCYNQIKTESGIKDDQGKPDHTMISNDLLDGLAAVRAFGAGKYSRDNWRQGFKFNRSLAAAYRHINAFKEGEDLDKESGLCHILHAIACLEHLLGDYLRRPHNDDRYKAPAKSNGVGNKEQR